MRSAITCLILAVFVIVVSYFTSVYLYKEKTLGGIDCYAKVRYDYLLNKDDTKDQAVITTGVIFSLLNGNGVISYSGKLFAAGHSYDIKRYVEISYTIRNDTSFMIHTTKLNISSTDNVPDDLANKYFYSYLRKMDGWLNVSIQPNGNNGYVISTTPIPQLLCRKL